MGRAGESSRVESAVAPTVSRGCWLRCSADARRKTAAQLLLLGAAGSLKEEEGDQGLRSRGRAIRWRMRSPTGTLGSSYRSSTRRAGPQLERRSIVS